MPTLFAVSFTLATFIVAASCGGNSTTATRAAEPAELSTPLPGLDTVPKWRGMTVAHEAYDGQRGYEGATMAASLDSLAGLYVNAVSIVPYTFMREATVPAQLPIPKQLGTESDSAVVAALQKVHARGWRVLLKPQIWVGNAWPGDVDFDTDADYEAFFEHYRSWILHYADLAELHHVEALCIGTELRHTTLKHPAAWRAIIAEVRQHYSGQLTYAANWGDEFEGIAFWDALDVVGLDAYYPLSLKPNPTDAELAAGAQEWMRTADAVASKAGRPLWLTEVGYRSVQHAWLSPHAEVGNRPQSDDCQRRSYAALATAARTSKRLTGMFVWKWPSYLGHAQHEPIERGGEGPGGFAPGGKPAAGVLEDWYASWE